MSEEHGARAYQSIVPEDFDLQARLHARTTTPDDEQPRCPECGTVNISHKTGHHIGAAHRRDGEWRCNSSECGAHFDAPERGEGE